MILVVIVAFFAGMGGILDEFQFHQPLVACTLIGLVTGNLTIGIILGGSLQMIALGWACSRCSFSICCFNYYFSSRWTRSKGYWYCDWYCYSFSRCWFVLNYVSSYYFCCHCSYYG